MRSDLIYEINKLAQNLKTSECQLSYNDRVWISLRIKLQNMWQRMQDGLYRPF